MIGWAGTGNQGREISFKGSKARVVALVATVPAASFALTNLDQPWCAGRGRRLPATLLRLPCGPEQALDATTQPRAHAKQAAHLLQRSVPGDAPHSAAHLPQATCQPGRIGEIAHATAKDVTYGLDAAPSWPAAPR